MSVRSFAHSAKVIAMLSTLLDLIRHKWHANSSLLTAFHQHDAASRNEGLRKLLHHTLMANRTGDLLTRE